LIKGIARHSAADLSLFLLLRQFNVALIALQFFHECWREMAVSALDLAQYVVDDAEGIIGTPLYGVAYLAVAPGLGQGMAIGFGHEGSHAVAPFLFVVRRFSWAVDYRGATATHVPALLSKYSKNPLCGLNRVSPPLGGGAGGGVCNCQPVPSQIYKSPFSATCIKFLTKGVQFAMSACAD
jgi:hypothetical protein